MPAKRYPLPEWDEIATRALVERLPELLVEVGLRRPTITDQADILMALEPVLFSADARFNRYLDGEIEEILSEDEEWE